MLNKILYTWSSCFFCSYHFYIPFSLLLMSSFNKFHLSTFYLFHLYFFFCFNIPYHTSSKKEKQHRFSCVLKEKNCDDVLWHAYWTHVKRFIKVKKENQHQIEKKMLQVIQNKNKNDGTKQKWRYKMTSIKLMIVV